MKKNRLSDSSRWVKWEKLLLVMKLTTLLVLIFVFNASASLYSQNSKISLQVENESLNEIFNKIEEQSEFRFFYQNEQIKDVKKKSVDVSQKDIHELVDNLLSETNLTFKLVDRNIIVYPQSQLNASLQQNRTVSGNITDSEGQPLPGVTVLIKGTTNGTISDFDGKYTIANVPTGSTLVFSFVGMSAQEIVVANQTSIDIVMTEDAIGIEEVVAIGYGVQKRRSLTSSVASVDVAEAVKIPTSSVSHTLQGRAAGLSVNLNSAQPGGAVKLQIRGSATNRSPLIVIDGMPTSDFSPSSVGYFGTGALDGVLSSLNPNDIENIDILKDASATSIYGSKAAGGVILITTKRGKKGEDRFSVDVNASTGIQEMVNLPEMLNAVDYMKETNRVKREKWLYDSRTDVYSSVPKPNGWVAPGEFSPYFSAEQIAEFENGTRTGTNWTDEVTRTGMVQNVDLSLSGNSKNTRYYASFGAFDQKGIIKNNDLSKYTGRVNVDQEIGDKTTVGVTINFSQINTDNVSIGNGGQWENSGVLMSSLVFSPTLPVYDENGNFSANDRMSVLPNPVSYLDITNQTTMERFFSSAFLKYNILPGLSIKTQLGFDRNASDNYGYLPTTTVTGASYNGRADRSTNQKSNYQFQTLLNYIKTFGDNHNLSATLGTEYMKYKWESFSARATDFPFDGILWNNMNLGAERPQVWSSGGSSEVISYFLRASYDYDYKYFVTANLRVDGSSNFSPENQYGIFPGVSLGWDISRESFMSSSSHWLNQLKLRVGYGQTGNDNLRITKPDGSTEDIGTAFSDYYSPGANTMWGNSIISGVKLEGLGNPDLKWEKQEDINVGLDFSFFNHRVAGSLEYFNRKISRIIGKKNLLSSNPVDFIAYNLDAIKQTYGTELTLNTKNIVSDKFNWNSDITFTYYRDRWLQRDPSYVLGINESPKQYFGELWYYETDGLVEVGSTDPLNPIPGTVKIVDRDGYLLDDDGNRVLDSDGKPQRSGNPDGKIDDADKVKVGVNTPFTIGFNNTFNYGNFDLSVYTYGVFNRWKLNETYTKLGVSNPYTLVSTASNIPVEALDRWNSDNLEGTGVSALQSSAQHGTGDFFLEDAWFIRVRDITLGYTLPKHILQNAKIKRLRFYCNITNPFLFTPYTGMDPETDQYVAAYPNHRSYNLGIQLSF